MHSSLDMKIERELMGICKQSMLALRVQLLQYVKDAHGEQNMQDMNPVMLNALMEIAVPVGSDLSAFSTPAIERTTQAPVNNSNSIISPNSGVIFTNPGTSISDCFIPASSAIYVNDNQVITDIHKPITTTPSQMLPKKRRFLSAAAPSTASFTPSTSINLDNLAPLPSSINSNSAVTKIRNEIAKVEPLTESTSDYSTKPSSVPVIQSIFDPVFMDSQTAGSSLSTQVDADAATASCSDMPTNSSTDQTTNVPWFTDADKRALIHQVHEHPCLWDPQNPFYAYIPAGQRAWQKICENLHLATPDVLKDQWMKLRDCYRKKRLKQTRKPDRAVRWTFLDDMSFVPHAPGNRRSVFYPRKNGKNVNPSRIRKSEVPPQKPPETAEREEDVGILT